MAKARSGEWKIAARICDDLMPEHESDKSIVGEVVRQISQIRDDETKRVAGEFEMMAAELLWEGVQHVPFAMLKKACALADKPLPEDPYEYLRLLWANQSVVNVRERTGPDVMYRR